MSLTVGLVPTIEFTGTLLQIPEGIVYLPHAVELVSLEDVYQVRVPIEVGVHLEETHLHKIVVELPFVDHLPNDIRVLEDELHEASVANVFADILVVCLSDLGCHLLTAQFTVLIVHKPLVALRGLHGDLQRRLLLKQFYERRAHRLDTARHDSTESLHPGPRMEHLGEVEHHSAGYCAMLLASIARQLAPATLGVSHHQLHLLEHTLSRRCQFIETVGMSHHLEGNVETTAAADIARTMPTVMREIEGLLACRSRCVDSLDTVGIGIVVTSGEGGISLDKVDYRLGSQSRRKPKGQ